MSQTFLNAPLVDVAGPTPQPSGFGLYAAVGHVIDAPDVKLREGVRWLDNIAGATAAFAIANWAPVYHLATDGAPLWVEAPAFGISAGIGVDHPLGVGLQELQDLARLRLSLQESSSVEAAYWTGKDNEGNPTGAPSLAGSNPTVLATSPVSLGLGLGLLEEWIGGVTGALGIIHVPRRLIGTLTSVDVRRDGGRLRTLVDTPLAAGTGYYGTGPDGTRPAGTAWLYATGPAQVLRSPVLDVPTDPRFGMDRDTDAAAVHAVRYVSVGHDAGAAAVQITLT